MADDLLRPATATGLHELAQRYEADLLVIGTHGRGVRTALRRLVHGSVSSRLVHGECRPVLVVPGGTARR